MLKDQLFGKPHFARALLEKGYISELEEAYDLFFNKEPLNKIKRTSLSPKETIQLIKNANGIAVFAHPHCLNLTEQELEDFIVELKSYGLDGIECYHSKHSSEQIKLYEKLAKKHDLLLTLGSDYHRISNIEVGHGLNNNLVPYSNNASSIITNLNNYYKHINTNNLYT